MQRRASSATGEDPAAAVWSGSLAGLRLDADRRLEGCGDRLATDGRLGVRPAGGVPGGGAFVEPPGEAGSGWLRRDGRRLLLAGEADWGRRVRRLLPYASWLQGLPVLHAAAVARCGRLLALIGASGAGKSSLARRLVAAGYSLLADDLLPCRPCGSGVEVPLPGGRAAPLAALVFLERGSSARPRLEELGRRRLLRELARHGWSDLVLAELWRRQFEFYLTAAASCQGVRLVLPDDRERLDETALAAAALLAGV